MMNILITGVNGMVGKAIAEELHVGNNVIGASRAMENKTSLPIDYVSIDIANKSLLEVFSNIDIDVIVHCAASLDTNSLSEELISTNCTGLRNMAALALKQNCKQFIYISSIPIIGKPIQLPITEEHPVHPETVYHTTKYFGELYLNNALKEIDVAILRLPSPIGVDLNENKIISVIVNKCINNEDIILRGKGERIQNYLDVKDIANSVSLSIQHNISGIYNIAAEKSYSNRELAEITIQLFNSSSKIRYEGVDEEEEDKWIISIEKAKHDLNFKPAISIEISLIEISKRLVI